MAWVATAIVSSAVIGGYSANKSADKQVDASNYATNVATAEQARQYDQSRQDTAPYRQAGENALNDLNSIYTSEGRYNSGILKANQLQQEAYSMLENLGPQGSPGFQERHNAYRAKLAEANQLNQQVQSGEYNPAQSEALPEFNPSRKHRPPQFEYGDTPPEFQGDRFAYGDAPPEFQGGAAPPEYAYSDAPPEFSYDQSSPEFSYDKAPPEFQGGNAFNFDLESDAGYRFARDEGINATNRAMAGQGKFNAGGRAAAIADRVTGIASQYADNAFNRQMSQSKENYGRDLDEYNIGAAREGDIYGRSRGEYGLNVDRERDAYGRRMSEYGLQAGREADLYNRGLTTYGINSDRNNTVYNRNLNEYGIDANREQTQYGRALAQNEMNYGRDFGEYGANYGREADMYGRALDSHGRDTAREQTYYNRDLDRYGLDYQRNQDMYGRDQTDQNRLASLAGVGQTSVAQSSAAGANMANNIGNIQMANASAQGNAANTKYGGMNQAIQGGMQNLLTYNYLKPQTPQTGLGGGAGIMGGGYYPQNNPYSGAGMTQFNNNSMNNNLGITGTRPQLGVR